MDDIIVEIRKHDLFWLRFCESEVQNELIQWPLHGMKIHLSWFLLFIRFSSPSESASIEGGA